MTKWQKIVCVTRCCWSLDRVFFLVVGCCCAFLSVLFLLFFHQRRFFQGMMMMMLSLLFYFRRSGFSLVLFLFFGVWDGSSRDGRAAVADFVLLAAGGGGGDSWQVDLWICVYVLAAYAISYSSSAGKKERAFKSFFQAPFGTLHTRYPPPIAFSFLLRPSLAISWLLFLVLLRNLWIKEKRLIMQFEYSRQYLTTHHESFQVGGVDLSSLNAELCEGVVDLLGRELVSPGHKRVSEPVKVHVCVKMQVSMCVF